MRCPRILPASSPPAPPFRRTVPPVPEDADAPVPDHPLTTLDTYATGADAVDHRTQRLGPVVPVELDSTVKYWATADHAHRRSRLHPH